MIVIDNRDNKNDGYNDDVDDTFECPDDKNWNCTTPLIMVIVIMLIY